MPKVSVIIPIYGVEKYIERCACSLFEQTLDDIEYIFVNDCTKDRSLEILFHVLKRYPHREKQVRIISMLANSGQAAVRKHGTQLATGEYLIHCDSDDWVMPEMYQKLYEEAIKSNLDIVWCDYYKSDGFIHNHIIQSTQPELMQGPLWNKLVRRSLYTNNNIVYPQHNKAEDGALMTQISFYGRKRGYVNQPLYFYFINSESICGQISEEACVAKLEQEVENTKLRIRFLNKEGVSNKYKSNIISWKYEARKNLAPLMGKRYYRKLWRRTFPELNKEYLCDNKINLKNKIRFLLIYLGIYRKI